MCLSLRVKYRILLFFVLGEQKCGEIDELRKKVQELFNQKYGEFKRDEWMKMSTAKDMQRLF